MKTSILLVAAVLLLVGTQAYCPNLCSGHGSCSSDDKCVCYTQKGTNGGGGGSSRAAWTGADCSQRTCPIAAAWTGISPNGASSMDVAVPAVAVGDTSFDVVGDLTAHIKSNNVLQIFNPSNYQTTYEVTVISATFASGATTITFYPAVDAAIAVDTNVLLYANSNNGFGAHATAECANQGDCNRKTGVCECYPGYEGESCTRTACESDCSGHGICLALGRLMMDNGLNYNAGWDENKHFGCKCDMGFRGPSCSMQECPSSNDPMGGCPNSNGGHCQNYRNDGEQRDCSGRGVCDYSKGLCSCFSGFYGEACENQTILI